MTALPIILSLGIPLWTSAEPFSVDGGTVGLSKAPVLLHKTEAPFPAEMLDAGVGGTVVMEIDIDEAGAVTEARIVQSGGPAFDQAAVATARQFVFSPAELNGTPVAVRLLYTYEFLYRPQPMPIPRVAGEVNFRGRILERGTRQPLEGATIVIGKGSEARETVSDAQGAFELTDVPEGLQPVVVVEPDHVKFETTENIRADSRREVTYFVRRKVYGPYETVVRGARERKEVSEVSLRQEEIRLIPGTQGDAFKVIQNLPGVARAPFSLGLLVVRGGKPADTRTYVDDTFVPLLFHFGGLFSTFNSNLLEDIRFEPGNFGAEYGRSIGGLVRGKTRKPSSELFHGYADINLIDASALIEGPLSPEWSFLISGRRSYIDLLLPLVLRVFAPDVNRALSLTIAPRYYDYQLKVDYHPKNSKNHFSFGFFGSNDQLALVLQNPTIDPEGRATVATLIGYDRFSFNWERQINQRLRFTSRSSVGIDRFNFSGGSDIFFYATSYPIVTRDEFQIELPEERLSLRVGTDLWLIPYRYTAQSRPPFKINQVPDPFISRSLIRERATQYTVEPAIYLEAVWSPLPKLKLVPGIRGDWESYMNKGWVDPRLSAFYQIRPRTSVKGGVGLYHQPPDYRQGLLSPKFGNPRLLPEGAMHYSVGWEEKLTDAISLDVQLYYKSLFHQAQPTLALPPGQTGADAVDSKYDSLGVGRSYGVEFLLRHQLTRNFFGWISYSLSKSERKYPGSTQYRLHPFDQPHNLIAVGSYKLPYDFIVGLRARYTSGPLNTPYVGAIYDANGNYYFPLFGEYFSRRLPAFFQLDVRVDKRFVYEKWILSLYADVQNVTNRQNAETLVYNFDYTQEKYLNGLPIIPSLGVRGEF